ncbi:MAG TPA: hypothetical protein VF275_09905 [Gammaproteobacteria bacterium]
MNKELMMRNHKFVLAGCLFSLLAANTALAAPADIYKVSLQITRDSVLVATPAVEVNVGKETVMSVTDSVDSHDYKLHVQIERVFNENGDDMAEVALKLFEEQDQEWKLVSTPRLTSKLGELVEFSLAEPDSPPHLVVSLRVTALDVAAVAATRH